MKKRFFQCFWNLFLLSTLTTQINVMAKVNSPMTLSEVKFWGYQIQDINTHNAAEPLANSYYDMLVLEPTRTDWSSDDKYFDMKGIVARIKNSNASDGIHRKLVIAYIDIG